MPPAESSVVVESVPVESVPVESVSVESVPVESVHTSVSEESFIPESTTEPSVIVSPSLPGQYSLSSSSNATLTDAAPGFTVPLALLVGCVLALLL